MSSRKLLLANGLQCQLYHQPDARQAAALIRIEAGSLDEANQWPGLAHLLEHLLFCPSTGFSASESLMPWVQRQGGQLNATTQLKRSAYFFQVSPSRLEAGLHRLCDMLARPLLTTQAIRQEITVIDAEYRLLQNHPQTLSQAALFETLSARFRRFRVGSRAAFGENVAALQTALQHYHRCFYHASGMRLWLQGPQPLDQLELLAEKYGALLPANRVKPVAEYLPVPTDDRLLRLDGEESFWLTLMLEGAEALLRSHVALLNAFCLDDAAGGLMARLRQEALCDSLDVQWLWQDARRGWLALRFSGPGITSPMAGRIESLFWHYLSQVSASDTDTQMHYHRLAQQDFAALSPLDQLRGHALNVAPASLLPGCFGDFIASLPRQPRSRLLTQRSLPGKAHRSQGFELNSVSWVPDLLPVCPALNFTLYSPADPGNSLCSSVETLLLRPAFYQGYDQAAARARLRLLRPILAALRHGGGRGRWRQAEGVWQLELDLPVARLAEALTCIRHALNTLKTEIPAARSDYASDRGIGQLMTALAGQLLEPGGEPGWLAAWCGENARLHQRAAPLLTGLVDNPDCLPGAPPLRSGITHVADGGGNSALLVFIPLARRDDASLAALRALALLIEPRFFHCLRVKQQIGYVVRACYQRVADVDGLQLVLQSPSVSWRRLLGHCKRFLRAMRSELRCCNMTDLTPLQMTLLEECRQRDKVEMARHRLRQQQGLPCLAPEAITSLKPEQIEHCLLCNLREHRRWRILAAGP